MISSTEQYSHQPPPLLFNHAVTAMTHHDYRSAANQFEAFVALYPLDNQVEQAQLDLIYCYFKQADMTLTLAACDRYLRVYPYSAHVDYVYYVRGMAAMNANRGVLSRYLPARFAERDLTLTTKAYQDFNLMIRLVPNSPYAPDAIQRMIYIRNILAEQQLEIAIYYFNIKAYVAAINRANEVVLYYQSTPSIIDALLILEKSYRALGLASQAAQITLILNNNFNKNNIKNINKKL